MAVALCWGHITEEQFDSHLFSEYPRHTLHRAEGAAHDARWRIDHHERVDRSPKGMPGLSVYAGSKAALRSFTRSWVVELAERRIRVNVLSPGPIATNAMANLPTEAKENFRSGIPRKELGRSEEIATVALFLASDDSTFVNGSEICVDGGYGSDLALVDRGENGHYTQGDSCACARRWGLCQLHNREVPARFDIDPEYLADLRS